MLILCGLWYRPAERIRAGDVCNVFAQKKLSWENLLACFWFSKSGCVDFFRWVKYWFVLRKRSDWILRHFYDKFAFWLNFYWCIFPKRKQPIGETLIFSELWLCLIKICFANVFLLLNRAGLRLQYRIWRHCKEYIMLCLSLISLIKFFHLFVPFFSYQYSSTGIYINSHCILQFVVALASF